MTLLAADGPSWSTRHSSTVTTTNPLSALSDFDFFVLFAEPSRHHWALPSAGGAWGGASSLLGRSWTRRSFGWLAMDIDGGSESVASMDEMPVDETAPFGAGCIGLADAC